MRSTHARFARLQEEQQGHTAPGVGGLWGVLSSVACESQLLPEEALQGGLWCFDAGGDDSSPTLVTSLRLRVTPFSPASLRGFPGLHSPNPSMVM